MNGNDVMTHCPHHSRLDLNIYWGLFHAKQNLGTTDPLPPTKMGDKAALSLCLQKTDIYK